MDNSSAGTPLQHAIHRSKQDFVRILLDYGFAQYFAKLARIHFHRLRVDPTAVSEVEPRTPLEIALELDQHLEMLHTLAKFMEMPVNMKHTQLALLANSTEADEFCKTILFIFG